MNSLYSQYERVIRSIVQGYIEVQTGEASIFRAFSLQWEELFQRRHTTSITGTDMITWVHGCNNRTPWVLEYDFGTVEKSPEECSKLTIYNVCSSTSKKAHLESLYCLKFWFTTFEPDQTTFYLDEFNWVECISLCIRGIDDLAHWEKMLQMNYSGDCIGWWWITHWAR